jgi:hypothetical protein
VTTIADLLAGLALCLVAIVLAAILPARAACPPGWALGEGIRPNGEYACHAPLPRDCGEDGQPPCAPPARRPGRVYCTGGHVPVTVDGRTVACQARH